MMAAVVRYMCYCAASGADSDDTLWLENARMATPVKPDPASTSRISGRFQSLYIGA